MIITNPKNVKITIMEFDSDKAPKVLHTVKEKERKVKNENV